MVTFELLLDKKGLLILRLNIITTGDFKEGNGANSRFRALAKGFMFQGLEVKFYFLLPSEFNDNNVNRIPKGFYEGVEYEYLSGTIARPRKRLKRIQHLLRAKEEARKVLQNMDKEKDWVYFYSPNPIFVKSLMWESKKLGLFTITEIVE